MNRTAALLILILAGTSPWAVGAPQGPELGRPADPQAIAAWDIGVMPDGTGLPAGGGNARQGKAIYEKQCLSCHGRNGLGDSGDQLAGAQMGLTSDYPEKTIGNYWPYATTLFDFNRRAMPMTAPGSLTDDEVYAVTAYLLFLNGIIKETDEMNAKTLPKVVMPNRDGFIDLYPEK